MEYGRHKRFCLSVRQNAGRWYKYSDILSNHVDITWTRVCREQTTTLLPDIYANTRKRRSFIYVRKTRNEKKWRFSVFPLFVRRFPATITRMLRPNSKKYTHVRRGKISKFPPTPTRMKERTYVCPYSCMVRERFTTSAVDSPPALSSRQRSK